ncbi:MAG: IclR family transcriptional regulator [Pseudomonadota bacterium]
MSDPSEPAPKDYTIAAVDRALTVLEALGDHPDQGVTQISKRLGMTKTLVFRILSTLESRGFVTRDGDQATYALGYRMGVLGERAGEQNVLLAAARPVMERLREDTAENINLVVREENRSLVLATLAGRHAIRIFAQSGRLGPLHAGGGSLVLLAHAPPSVQAEVLSGALDAFTPTTITDADDLSARLAQIRADDYLITQDDLDEGAFSIAAPIRNRSNTVVAALSVAGAVVRLNDLRREAYLRQVRDAAAEVTVRLGLRSFA